MLKFATVLVIMLIGSLLAAGLSCNSCGRECAPACGTRYFRSCCFNYLRRKRGPETQQFLTKNLQYLKPGTKQLIEDEWSEAMPSEFEHYNQAHRVDSSLRRVYL
ncbi:uncharacterized protein LOC126779786 [Nymphalis io]|uniref:uncharacterized protein LOC126779786 n=1 Tax=Inachis io TaxID=171585 RepID=UPI002166E21C|nr:uncharacterized protein LOC126779786 [Nymphalis io]